MVDFILSFIPIALGIFIAGLYVGMAFGIYLGYNAKSREDMLSMVPPVFSDKGVLSTVFKAGKRPLFFGPIGTPKITQNSKPLKSKFQKRNSGPKNL